jgi:hypothetical protein
MAHTIDPVTAKRLADQLQSGNWLDGRNFGDGLPGSDELNTKLQCVVEFFGIGWLMREQDHPISNLWKRDDFLATNELLLLGDSLSRLRTVDHDWTKDQVARAKRENQDNRIGAQFELIALGALETHGQHVMPLRKNHPGCDALVTLSQGTQVYLSLKNFGVGSAFEKAFRMQASGVADFLRAEMGQRRMNGVALAIVAAAYPFEADWQTLRSTILSLLNSNLHSSPISQGIWSLYPLPLPGGQGSLHENYVSYQCTMLAAYHQNEKKNLLDKLYGAAVNLEKHNKAFPYAAYKGLLVRLPEDASVAACSRWVRDFYDDRPGTHVDFIWLYQASIVTDRVQNTTSINHSFVPIPRDPTIFPFRGEAEEKSGIIATFYVGTCTINPSRLVIGPAPGRPVVDAYMFQRGEIYRRAAVMPSGDMQGQMNLIGDGIIEHTVFNALGGEMVLSGKFPRSNRVTLLT